MTGGANASSFYWSLGASIPALSRRGNGRHKGFRPNTAPDQLPDPQLPVADYARRPRGRVPCQQGKNRENLAFRPPPAKVVPKR
jgi:hypothetical protein